MKLVFHTESLRFKLLNAIALNALLFHICFPAYASGNSLSNPAQKNVFFTLPVKENKQASGVETSEVKEAASPQRSSATQLMASGPGQVESNSYSINSNDNILNKFTGDMSYSIPLMDVDGFPIKINYDPNISMDQEASWVGLGWDLSLGSITRDMRGVPDDFNGDVIQRHFEVSSEKVTDGNKFGVGVTAGVGIGLGISSLNFSTGFQAMYGSYMNSYTGKGHTKDFGVNLGVNAFGFGVQGSLGYSKDDQNGIGVSSSITANLTPTVLGTSFGGKQFGWSTSVNSREGILTKMRSVKDVSSSLIFNLGSSSSSTYGSAVSYGKQTYVPKYSFNSIRTGHNQSGSFTLTALLGVGFAKLRFVDENYESETRFSEENKNLRAYGYFNYAASENDPLAMLDFNRDGKNEPSSEAMHLNFSQPTFDVFSCNAPGITTNFRAHRYEIVRLHDPKITNEGHTITRSGDGGIFGGVTFGPTGGIEIGESDGTVTSNSSTSEGIDTDLFNYVDKNTTYNGKEYYLKTVGEATPQVDHQLYNSFFNNTPARLQLLANNIGNYMELNGQLESNTGALASIPASTVDLNRKDNIINYREYSGEEFLEMGFEIKKHNILLTSSSNLHYGEPATVLPNLTPQKKEHHIQAIEVTNDQGSKYFFGIPNYSYSHATASVSVKPDNMTDPLKNGLVRLTSTNKIGRQNITDEQVMPAYAHSFLLTEIYSNDYVDLSQNGPSRDDIGNYFKINYTNVYSEQSPFLWRFPIAKTDNMAFYLENIKTDPWDDMAMVTYGEKDVWYGQSVESKDMIAFFKLEPRKDMNAFDPVTGILISGFSSFLLKRIELYSKNDLQANGNNAKPVQVVEFEYDYSLCPNYPGNSDYYDNNQLTDNGKLTLKAIYSYTGESKEFKTSPYKFTYPVNPSFAHNSSDRWGNYKPNPGGNLFNQGSVAYYPNHKFPYAEQDEALANANIQAWKLKTIQSPEGGITEFEYAADSYSFVQNKRPMRMFSIEGMSGLSELSTLNNLPGSSVDENVISGSTTNRLREEEKKNPNEVIYFKLAEPLNASNISEANQLILQQYFRNELGQNIDQIMLNLNADLGNKQNGLTRNMYEYVQSVITLEKSGGQPRVGVVGNLGSGPWDYGYMIIETDGINENSDNYLVSSLQMANWEFARKNAPYLIYGEPDYNAASPLLFCDYSTDLDGRVVFGLDVNKKINKEEFGIFFKRGESQVRLFEPDNVKMGGNARVVSITYRNRWQATSGEEDAAYTWEYNYGSDGLSGVVAYEPQTGATENPFYQLEGYDLERYFLPDEKKYHFMPVCDMMYPAPIVGYPKIESFFSPDIVAAEKSVGKNIEYYHTSKEFPVICKYSSSLPLVIVDRMEDEAFVSENKKITREQLGLSEGFVVETNDMHGKLDRLELYDAGNNLVSKQKYIYTDRNGVVRYLKDDGTIENKVPPREIDMYVDSWENSFTGEMLVTGNYNTFGVVYVGIPIPIIMFGDYDNASKYERHVKGFTFTKTIHYISLVEKVESFTLGSHNSAENLLYDFHSGSVLLSSLNDEFDDPLFHFSYPAYWKHRSFENLNEVDGAVFRPVPGSGNTITSTGSGAFRFTEGDHYKITFPNSTVSHAWVIWTNLEKTSAKLIDADGVAVNTTGMTNAVFQVVKSGRKNRISENMMSIRTKRNPIANNICNYARPGQKNQIALDISAVLYEDKGNVPCPEENGVRPMAALIDPLITPSSLAVDQKVNPYLIGAKGNYQPVKSLVYQAPRDINNPNDVREDGEMTYVPFYGFDFPLGQPAGNEFTQWYGVNEGRHPAFDNADLFQSWRNMGTVDVFDEQHIPVQISNPIKVSSSHLKILNERRYILQEALAGNAKYHEIGFDGFEFGLSLAANADNSFNLNELLTNAQRVTNIRHSGNYALEVDQTASASFPVKPTVDACAGGPNIVGDEYYVRECDCIPNFEQEEGKSYFFSVWVKELTPALSYSNSAITITFSGGGSQTFHPSGIIIDGWQKIEGKYTVLSGQTMAFQFINNSAGKSYFDDFRTHPYRASMQSIVYDPNTLLPIASHDSYNFTTFYNYDKNHQLVRVKVETVEGIKTLSEEQIGTFRDRN